MEALVYGAKQVSPTTPRQFQVRLNRARQVATTWADHDLHKGIERLERQIHQVTPVECKVSNNLFQHHERQLLQQVGTKATSRRSIFATELAIWTAAAEDETYRAANMTTDKGVNVRIHVSNVETAATTWSLADTERITNQLEREIYCITSNQQKQFKKEFSIHWIEFQAWWEAISIQAVRNTIDQRAIHFGYPRMHLVGHVSESIGRISSSDCFTTKIFERLHIANVKEAY